MLINRIHDSYNIELNDKELSLFRILNIEDMDIFKEKLLNLLSNKFYSEITFNDLLISLFNLNISWINYDTDIINIILYRLIK